MAIVRTTKEETPLPGAPKKATPRGATARQPLPQRAPAKPSGQFINETRAELGRVTWPSKEEVRAGTIVTIMMLAFFALYVSGLDYMVEQVFQAIGLLPDAAANSPR